MKFCNRLFYYVLVISFCSCHDLHHADPTNVKRSDSSAIEENIQKPKPINAQSPTPSVESTTVRTVSSVSSEPIAQKLSVHPRIIHTEDEAKQTTTTTTTTTATLPIINPNPKLIIKSDEITTQTDDINKTMNNNMTISNSSENKTRQVCWHLPMAFEPSIQLLEIQIFRFINLFPDFLQTILFGPIDDRELLMNTMWFSSIWTMCGLFSFLFLSMGTKRLKQTKQEKEVRAHCQKLQQSNNQIELERATLEQQNLKLSEQIDKLKQLTVRDSNDELYAIRAECQQLREEFQIVCYERDNFKHELEFKQNLIRKYEHDTNEHGQIIANLNHQINQFKQDSDKDRTVIARLQSGEISLENYSKSQELIQILKSEISQLKQDKFSQQDQCIDIQQCMNEVNIENHRLIYQMKQFKQLFEQFRIQLQHIDSHEIQSIVNETILNTNHEFLMTIEQDIQKSSDNIRNLYSDITERNNRIQQLETIIKQEQARCREMETKLKVVLELRERDAHLHIRQLGQTDAELRKARTDADRIRILQQQLDLKQQQLDDVQTVLSNEQAKFNDECAKLQHEIHEKWMEVKRLTRELNGARKECENYRKQITQRSLQDKSLVKPIAQNLIELEPNNGSPMTYQYGENFRSIDQQRHESGTSTPADMLIPRPPPPSSLFACTRPPFFQPPPPPRPNTFIMHPRFPMPVTGMMSPMGPLLVNSNDGNKSGLIDNVNLTPNSVNETSTVDSSYKENVDDKKLKAKKTKKKNRTSVVKENV